ncbi:MAG: UvrD-helicase domain-containing protein [Ghiorsea sp.]|nr:UvrD-helicase domain-containing protein [Ghiorsea sp.]
MKNIQLISASAGSGKTYRLMNEIGARVAGKSGVPHVQPEQIMATTFTNKAAAELKERIRMRLLEEGKSAEAQRIYDGLIGTVNSICSKLLKEYAFEAGLSPAVDVLLEDDASRIFNMATASAIAISGKTLEPIARRLSLMGYGSRFAKQDDWREYVQRIVDLARSNAMDAATLKAAGDESWASLEKLLGQAHTTKMGAGIDKRLKDAVNDAVAAIQANIEDTTKSTSAALSSLQKAQRTLNNFGANSLSWEDWLGLSGLKTGAKSKDLVDEVNQLAADHLKHPRFRQDMESMIKGVFDCAANALTQYAEYKREQGLMDFVDQEALVLDMATNNVSFRASMKERVKLLMVDEFQDTSPIQLALFLKLSELAEEVIWVGDQKQSIYGFRGADPVLMDAVAHEIEQGATSAAKGDVLKESWRSKRALVEFCNAIFSPVFHHMDEAKVCLDIPDARKDSAEGGWLENWVLEGRNAGKRSNALVQGVQALLDEKEVKAGEIAILCRSNNECETISASLKAAGIRASIAQGDLLATQECTLALAALRYMADDQDSIALSEIVCYSHHHYDHDDWLAHLLSDSQASQDAWKQDAMIQALDKLSAKGVYLTPLEALEQAMAAVELERTIYAWGDVEQRLSNLDQLRAACIEYQDRCRSRRDSATVSGLLTWLFGDADLKQAKSAGDDTVNVLTYHKSKGLEWPVVIMSSLNKASRSGVFGVSVVEADTFVADKPLQGRSLRFWPWCYGTKKKAEQLDALISGSDIATTARLRTLAESNRLLYVGLTRARDGLVLVQQKTKNSAESKWLDELVNDKQEPVLSFDDNECTILSRKGTTDAFDVNTRHLVGSEDVQPLSIADKPAYLPQTQSAVDYPSATVAPSSMDWDDASKQAVPTSVLAQLGDAIERLGNHDAADFGNAMHGFLGADIHIDEAARINQAKGLLQAWGVEGAVAPEDMLKTSDRLKQFIQDNYAKGKVLAEWPIEMVLDNHQRLSGWVDMLIELDDGYVVIDHKSYSGGNVEEYAKQYAPQLAVYRDAVVQATGKPVLQTLIHLPMTGQMVDVQLP